MAVFDCGKIIPLLITDLFKLFNSYLATILANTSFTLDNNNIHTIYRFECGTRKATRIAGGELALRGENRMTGTNQVRRRSVSQTDALCVRVNNNAYRAKLEWKTNKRRARFVSPQRER